jgi:hypothetical protein
VTAIPRRQAYARLVIAMVDRDLPAPKSIGLDSHGPLVELATVEEFEAWRAAIGGDVCDPFVGSGGIRSHTSGAEWQGMDIVLTAMIHAPKPEPITEDLTSVREAAGVVSE